MIHGAFRSAKLFPVKRAGKGQAEGFPTRPVRRKKEPTGAIEEPPN